MADEMKKDDIFKIMEAEREKKKETKPLSISEYLELCKKDKEAYATAAERLLAAIGEPELVDTKNDPKLSKIFQNKTIARYNPFKDFYGMEDSIMRIVSFLKKSASGLEESKQVLYLLGPVGSAKSSLADKLTSLMQEKPFYTLRSKKTGELSPVFESPLGLFSKDKYGEVLEETYGIPKRYLRNVMSPWAVKRLQEAGDDWNEAFEIVKIWPSADKQIAVSKTIPGDPNTQDVSDLVGKVDLSKIGDASDSDADSYAYSGSLCRGNRGVMEFVEMFKADIKILNPLLEATQSGKYNGTQTIGSLPFDGIILAHSNETEWHKFSNNRANEAFLDRVCIVKVPYSLRVSEELKIYQKYVKGSAHANDPIAPQTLETLAEFSVLTRLEPPANSNIIAKMKAYDGENVTATDPSAKTITEYKEASTNAEGMSGWSVRTAHKTISETFNARAQVQAGVKPSADPVTLMQVLEKQIKESEMPDEQKSTYIGFIKEHLEKPYAEFLDKEIKEAYLDDNGSYGQNMFTRYFNYAQNWLDESNYIDSTTTQVLDKKALEDEMEKIEKPSNISNVRDFRNEFVRFVLRHQASHNGEMPSWKSFEKMKQVIEKRMFSSMEDIMPIISFDTKATKDDGEKHDRYVSSMEKKGYTNEQVRFLTGWYTRRKVSA